MKQISSLFKILIFIAFFVMVYFAIRGFNKFEKLKTDNKVTEAIITRTYRGYKFHRFYEYKFIANGKEYKSSQQYSVESENVSVGQKYYVVYSPENPTICKLKEDSIQRPVPVNLPYIPH